jgi:hypothetical protein
MPGGIVSVTDRTVTMATTPLPIDQLRRILLPPVQLAREGSVAASRTLRHWELMLMPPEAATAVTPDVHEADAREADGAEDQGVADLPVENWSELSFADAQARLSSCQADEIQLLLDYERSHGHRPRYALMLEQRLASIA